MVTYRVLIYRVSIKWSHRVLTYIAFFLFTLFGVSCRDNFFLRLGRVASGECEVLQRCTIIIALKKKRQCDFDMLLCMLCSFRNVLFFFGAWYYGPKLRLNVKVSEVVLLVSISL